MKAKLDFVEAQLQRLIEGSLARLFPSQQVHASLTANLIQAIRQNAQPDKNGVPSVPNLYTIFMHPSQIAASEVRKELAGHLSQTVYEALQSADLAPSHPIHITFAADPDLKTGETRIAAQAGAATSGETQTIQTNGKAARGHPLLSKAFLILHTKHIFPLDKPIITIGRQPGNDLTIEEPQISRLHAQIRLIEDRFFIFDLGSTGGTFVNEQRIKQQSLYPGDVISLAGTTLIFGQDEVDNQDITRPMTRK